MTTLGIALAGYLAGSIPFGFLIARWVAGIDLRAVGSGNIGATNASRVLGKKWGSLVLALDASKGLLPAWLLPLLFALPPEARLHGGVVAGVSAIVGHSFPIWLGFRGGKGVATSLGVALVLAPWGTLAAAAVFATVFGATRIVSASSLAAAIGFAIFQWFLLQPDPWSAEKWGITAFSLGIPLLIVVRHHSNIARLLRGEEHAWSGKHAATSASPSAGSSSKDGSEGQPCTDGERLEAGNSERT
uniref:Glycerol-3-phosphate acyltransferase n=1 Tax=Schlesneria paludicola TaxID=360056 RepID=A0A7C4LJK6_9PLAN